MIQSGFSLELRDVGLQRGGRTLIDGLSLELVGGQLALLMGANGSGKTSLLRAIAGLASVSSGTIELKANGATASASDRGTHAMVAYLGHLDGLKKDLTVEENIRFISGLCDSSTDVHEIIAELGLKDRARQSIRFLSAGQKRRVALASLRASRARLWLLDEPLTNLDRQGRDLLARWLDAHLALGGIAMVATHRLEEFRRPGCLLLEL